VNAFHKKAQKH